MQCFGCDISWIIFFSQKDIANKLPQQDRIVQSEIKKSSSPFNFHIYTTDFEVYIPRGETQKVPNCVLYTLYVCCWVLWVYSSSAKSSDILCDTNFVVSPFWGREHSRLVDAHGLKEWQKWEAFFFFFPKISYKVLLKNHTLDMEIGMLVPWPDISI